MGTYGCCLPHGFFPHHHHLPVPYHPTPHHTTHAFPGVYPNDMPNEKDFYSDSGFDIGPGVRSCVDDAAVAPDAAYGCLLPCLGSVSSKLTCLLAPAAALS